MNEMWRKWSQPQHPPPSNPHSRRMWNEFVTDIVFITTNNRTINPLNAELNPICHLLALLRGTTIVVVSRLRVNITTVCIVTVSLYIIYSPTCFDGPGVAQWLRRCATSRTVPGSIPGGVIGFFQWHTPSDRTMALGSTQPLTKMSTRNISWG